MLREALAAPAHDDIVAPDEDRAGDRRQEVHPRRGRTHDPLVRRGGARALVETPPPDALELAGRLGLEEAARLDLRRSQRESDRVREDAPPTVPVHAPDAAAVAFLELLDDLDAAPPLGPAVDVEDRLPDRLSGRIEHPGREEAVACLHAPAPGSTRPPAST